jgi:hypothetical protein
VRISVLIVTVTETVEGLCARNVRSDTFQRPCHNSPDGCRGDRCHLGGDGQKRRTVCRRGLLSLCIGNKDVDYTAESIIGRCSQDSSRASGQQEQEVVHGDGE